jgi:hypothetical protein
MFCNCVLLKGDIHATIQFKGVVNKTDDTIEVIVAGMKSLLKDKGCKKINVTYMSVKENNK